MKNIFAGLLITSSILLLSSISDARVLAGLVDRNGNPIHSGDEFTLHVNTTVTPDPQGYQYTYNITNDGLSNQSVWFFKFFFQDSRSVTIGSASSPWGQPTYPEASQNIKYNFSSYFACDPDLINPPPLAPGQTLTGYTFLSPYPPGMMKMYAEGNTNYPWYKSAPSTYDEYDLISPYGPGKVMSVIGPVKPTVGAAGVPVSNVTVQQCVGTVCTVQLSAIGPQDPAGTTYTYTWSGAFGSVPGAQPVLDLPVGTTPVILTVSDPAGTVLTIATMDIVVVDPNAVVTPPPGVNNDDDDDHDDHDDSEDDSDDDEDD